MLERALTILFRNLSTFFLIVSLLTVPLHLAYAYSFRNVIAVQELHEEIEDFPEMRQVRSVGRVELQNAEAFYLGLVIAELGFLALMTGAFMRVLERDSTGELPTVSDALRHLGSLKQEGRAGVAPRRIDVPGLISAFVLAIAIWWLGERLGLLVAQPLADDIAWVGDGLVRGLARALAAPFFLVPFALSIRSAKGAPGRTPTLY